MSLLEGLFDPAIGTSQTNPTHCVGDLFPVERNAIARAAPRRQQEFAAGRSCAREAMRKLGLPALPVPMGLDRAPQWPSHVVGSISHCKTRCVAVAALTAQGFLSLGVDIEESIGLDDDLCETICVSEEIAAIWRLAQQDRGLAATAIFSAKECVFKCQYQLSASMLDFHDLIIDLDLAAGAFRGRFAIDAAPFAMGTTITGKIRVANGYVVSGACLRNSDLPLAPACITA